jgi:uncharacterized protein
MDKAFDYGKIVNEDYFTDREKETALLTRWIKDKINCILIAPRRWGKSSLVN